MAQSKLSIYHCTVVLVECEQFLPRSLLIFRVKIKHGTWDDKERDNMFIHLVLPFSPLSFSLFLCWLSNAQMWKPRLPLLKFLLLCFPQTSLYIKQFYIFKWPGSELGYVGADDFVLFCFGLLWHISYSKMSCNSHNLIQPAAVASHSPCSCKLFANYARGPSWWISCSPVVYGKFSVWLI